MGKLWAARSTLREILGMDMLPWRRHGGLGLGLGAMAGAGTRASTRGFVVSGQTSGTGWVFHALHYTPSAQNAQGEFWTEGILLIAKEKAKAGGPLGA